ncbi:MAG: phosphotransferase [Propionibacteriales bacterium]|nr:phosphotransferase [Propionibacteriales bacterium]
MVFTDHQLSGVIDWDTASPGPRIWDLAYLAYRLVPLVGPGNPDVEGHSLSESARRLRLLCDAYGHGCEPEAVILVAVDRLRDLARFTAERATGEHDPLRSHVNIYLQDANWIATHAETLAP